MLEVFNKERVKVAILQNAMDMVETERLNAIATFSFSLPIDDVKNKYCQPFHFIRYNNGQLYRIMPSIYEESESGKMKYECEHVLALLIDDILLDYHVVGNLGTDTTAVIHYVLSNQRTKNWVLSSCQFSRQFEYGWENENLLSALFSIPKPFTEQYIWRYDTHNYPFKLYLDRIKDTDLPKHYIRKGHNRLQLIKQSDPKQICTRIYPKGAGEGVNQLNIKSVNGGLDYIQSPKHIVDKYGIISRVWVDRRYTNPQSLKENAQATLNELQQPFVQYQTEFIGACNVGDVVEIVGQTKSYITEINKTLGEFPQTTVKISNTPKNIADTIADLSDRQRIEMTYSQGATQIYADSIADNADSKTPIELRFYIDSSMKIINAVKCKIRLSRFRTYSESTSSGGSVQTSSNGGGTNTTTSSGGGKSTSTQGGGGGTTSAGGGTLSSTGSAGGTTVSGGMKQTSENGGNVTVPLMYPLDPKEYYTLNLDPYGTGILPKTIKFPSPQHKHKIPEHSHKLNTAHSHKIDDHFHSVTLEEHTHNTKEHNHSFDIPNHSHGFTVREHSHTLDTTHTHKITPSIHFFGGANNFWLFINGVKKQYFSGTDAEIDITNYLTENGNIPRGRWHTVGILPNDIARVEIAYQLQGFIQSRGDKTV